MQMQNKDIIRLYSVVYILSLIRLIKCVELELTYIMLYLCFNTTRTWHSNTSCNICTSHRQGLMDLADHASNVTQYSDQDYSSTASIDHSDLDNATLVLLVYPIMSFNPKPPPQPISSQKRKKLKEER